MSISFIDDEVSSAVDESASTFLATSLIEKVISSIEVADSCTLPARLTMFSATSSLAAAISRIDDDDSSAAAASVSTECAICLSDAVISCSDAAVSSMAPSCRSTVARSSPIDPSTLPSTSPRSTESTSACCSRCTVEYEAINAGTPPMATMKIGAISVALCDPYRPSTIATDAARQAAAPTVHRIAEVMSPNFNLLLVGEQSVCHSGNSAICCIGRRAVSACRVMPAAPKARAAASEEPRVSQTSRASAARTCATSDGRSP